MAGLGVACQELRQYWDAVTFLAFRLFDLHKTRLWMILRFELSAWKIVPFSSSDDYFVQVV